MKTLFSFFLIIFLVSCSFQWEPTLTEQPSTANIKNSQNSDCSAYRTEEMWLIPRIVWSFPAENSGKCWHIGFINWQFALFSDEIPLASSGVGNLLYSDGTSEWIEKAFQSLIEQWAFSATGDFPTAWEYYSDVIGRFLQKFEEHHIILPEKYIFEESYTEHFPDYGKNLKPSNPLEVDTLSNIADIRDLYSLLQKAQQK